MANEQAVLASDSETLHRMGYAQALGLDAQTFQDAMTRHAQADRVRQDFLGGVRSGVNGTPPFFINGERHDGPWDRESLQAALEQAQP